MYLVDDYKPRGETASSTVSGIYRSEETAYEAACVLYLDRMKELKEYDEQSEDDSTENEDEEGKNNADHNMSEDEQSEDDSEDISEADCKEHSEADVQDTSNHPITKMDKTRFMQLQKEFGEKYPGEFIPGPAFEVEVSKHALL